MRGKRALLQGLPEPPEPLPYPVVDAHCHLDVARFDASGIDAAGDPGTPALPVVEAVARAAAVNVTRIAQVGCDLPSSRWAVETARTHASVVAGVALHPNEVAPLAERGELDAALAGLDELAADPRVRFIGETGLDHYRTPEAGWPVQEDAFRAHIELAKKHGLPLQIHNRDAHADVLRVLAEAGPPADVVFHCFSGDAEIAGQCVERGYVLSFAGTVTFKNAHDLRAALAHTPLDQLLVETDAPYLAPMPYRGRTNASYLIPYTLRAMAQVKGVFDAELCNVIDSTAERLFGVW